MRRIFQWAAQGYGGRQIAGKLNRAGVEPFQLIGPKMKARIENGNAPKWHPDRIRLLLQNRAVIGYVQPCKRAPDGSRVADGPEIRLYPPVIGESLFEQVQLVVARRKGHSKGAGRKGNYANLFTGLCRCEVCGKGVIFRQQKNAAYLICEMARHRSCTNKSYFLYTILEKFVFENHVKLWSIWKMLLKLTPEPKDITSRIPELENELAESRMKRSRLVERFAEGDPDADRLIDDYDRQIRAKEKELDELRHDELVARHGDDFHERWTIAREKLKAGDKDARAKLATLLKERIVSVVLTPRRSVILAVTNSRRNSAIIRLEISNDDVIVHGDHDTFIDTIIEWQKLKNPHDKNIEPWTSNHPL